MPLELTAKSQPGERLVALAETLAGEIAPGVARHDRDGSFPFESLAAVRRSGYLTAPIPEPLGGMGVVSVHDVVVSSSRLAAGDPALALGINMHFAYLLNVVRRWHMATAAGDQRRAQALGSSLERIAAEQTVFSAASSELGQDLTRPATTATRTADGWIVSGRKAFCTLSPAADVFYTAVTFADDHGGARYGYALIPRDTPGVVVHDDWDALGMRGSGSNSVSFEDVRLPASALRGGFSAGDAVEYIDRNLNAGLLHAAAALGVAEAANAAVTARLPQRPQLDARTQVLAAENVIDLSASRAVLARAAELVDALYDRYAAAKPDADELTGVFGEAQSAKAFIGEAAFRIVDRSLALSGGAGYLAASPLARAYRDVRATTFMHPLGANRAHNFLGDLAAGRQPSLH